MSETLLDPFRGNAMPPVDTENSPRSELVQQPVTRRTPRVSLIVVIPENHVVSPDRLAETLRTHGDQEVNLVIACAGQPADLPAPQRGARSAQFLLAPAGTTTEDLRELAMRQVPGDIVTLLCGDLDPGSCAEARAS
jgi:hypothetical protein